MKTDERSLQVPFFCQFYLNTVKKNAFIKEWESIESKRKALFQNESEIEMIDLGAGSKAENSKSRKIKSIARHSLSRPKFSQFLFRLIKEFKFENIIELGTSLGINTAYMAKANQATAIFTFEGDPHSIKIAKNINADFENIKYYEGDIDHLLPEMLNSLNPKIDLVYADANHTYEASIEYFNIILPYLTTQSIYIMDDIHWSAGMKNAWEELKLRKEVTSSIDLFDAGLLFFNPDFQKQHYILDF